MASHREGVRDAIVHAAAELVAERGLLAVTMAEIATRSGIGRATLYRYFADVESVLGAWHERQVAAHLEQLAEIRERAAPSAKLPAVLEAYALLSHRGHGHHDQELAAFLHRGDRLAAAHDEVTTLVAELIAEAAQRGEVRDDIAPQELAVYCVHALQGASRFQSGAAVRRLAAVTVNGLRPVA